LRGLIRRAASAATGLRGPLAGGSFLPFCQVGKLLREFVNLLLSLLVLLTAGGLTALNVFVLVLTRIEFQSEKIGQILCAAAATATTASAAATLLHLDLRI
jgi:hypothetical protein